MPSRKTIAIIGGGAAGLMAADVLSQHCEVHIYEKGKALGRKFLVAGNGGFNLTNSAEGEALYNKYSPQDFLQPALEAFYSEATRNWLNDLGIPTFVGSSGRVFPEKGIKPIEVLQKLKDRLVKQGVSVHLQHEFIGFDAAQKPVLKYQKNEITIEADHYIFALGGASWPVTGSTGSWLEAFALSGIKTIAFQSSNCGVNVNWPAEFREKFAGAPLKNLQITVDNFSLKGEALITEYGLEGNAIYPVVPKVRETINSGTEAFLTFDLKPQNTLGQMLEKVRGQKPQPKNYEHFFKLSKAQLALLKLFTSKEDYLDPEKLVDHSLKKVPHISIVGEMLDWDAPTGGFLLQGCFSTAYFAAQAILKKSTFKTSDFI